MEDNWYLQECSDNDVISSKDKLFKLGKFRDALNYAFTNRVINIINGAFQEKKLPTPNTQELLTSGLDCEILKIGSKGWQPGKLRIKVTLEFCPDEPKTNESESPLDDLRRMIKEGDS
ncbi:KGK domain protein [Nostoc sp. B(2019)]|nr:KGK domain protein [Nostoc sp. B(2019)]